MKERIDKKTGSLDERPLKLTKRREGLFFGMDIHKA